MGRLEHVSADRLRDGLDAVEGKRATLRLVAGINYKHGITQSELADWYGVSRTTIHNWLDRLERLDREPLEDVVYDDPRPGRPAKLSAEQRERLASTLRNPPNEAGLDEPEWTSPLVRAFIEEEFGVAYSLRHVRTLVDDVGLE